MGFYDQGYSPFPADSKRGMPHCFMTAKAPQALPRVVHWPIHHSENAQSHLVSVVPGSTKWRPLR
jgi:hypothetical protein